MNDGTPESIERALELFDEIIALGKKSAFYDDALYYAASSLSQRDEDADYPKALELYRRLVNEFAAGESPFRDDAQAAIRAVRTIRARN